jgi:hypothetical protein
MVVKNNFDLDVENCFEFLLDILVLIKQFYKQNFVKYQ